MAYPAWDSGTSYAVGSIVSFNNLLYLATFYHNPANTDAPNVAVEPHPSNPALFGSQRSWTIYSTLPTGYSESPFFLSFRALTSPVEEDDRYFRSNVVPAIYYEGTSQEELAGTALVVNNPCPASQCVVALYRGNGFIYGAEGFYAYELTNPILAPSGTYYISGPGATGPGEINTLHVWYRTSSPSMFRRNVTLYAKTGEDGSGDPIITSNTFTPTDNTYRNADGQLIYWYAPGNEDTTFTAVWPYSPELVLNAYNIAPND
jgi:hypothetical protein